MSQEKIQRAFGLLFGEGQLVEVRVKQLSDGKCRSKFFTDPEQAVAAIDKADQTGKYEAIWYTLQRLNPKTVKYENEGTAREDIRSYECMVIDVDRPGKDGACGTRGSEFAPNSSLAAACGSEGISGHGFAPRCSA